MAVVSLFSYLRIQQVVQKNLFLRIKIISEELLPQILGIKNVNISVQIWDLSAMAKKTGYSLKLHN